MCSPNHLLLNSQSYILVELLQKHAAAANRKGVVGKIGNTIPMAPRATQTKPTASHSALMIFCPFFSHFIF
jgi:hypothetical protein